MIRAETQADAEAVRRVYQSAFETGAEADIADALRGDAGVSLVAERDGEIVGHIMFSPAILSSAPALQTAALAPMAVAPNYQRRGIGSALVQNGLARCREKGIAAVVLVGHQSFYPRFGFRPASDFGLRCEYENAGDAFMALELRAGALADKSGLVKFHPALADDR